MLREMGEAALKSQPDLPSEPPVSNNFRLGRDADGEEVDSEEEFEEDLEVIYSYIYLDRWMDR